jgi:hypothetical protein
VRVFPDVGHRPASDFRLSEEGDGVPRTVRKGRNQALFRQVNERIAEIAADYAVANGVADFVCECSHLGCTEQVKMPTTAYGRIRDELTTFIVLAGHEDLEHEEVVERHDGYLIVRSILGIAPASEQHPALDTRSPRVEPARGSAHAGDPREPTLSPEQRLESRSP